ncbi:hypothetical protein AALF85_02635 [Jeotgalicoccus halotolerans]|uniref:hypothetical protein n=1 Tax=Jeotgalicoccus halotolerans TaxID=157227 RepID=UPI0035177551
MSERIFERKVVKSFTGKKEKQDYIRGHKFKGNEKRVKELTDAGYLEKVDIPKVEAAVPDNNVETADQLKHVGGGYYELPNGERVQGEENAKKALAEAGE